MRVLPFAYLAIIAIVATAIGPSKAWADGAGVIAASLSDRTAVATAMTEAMVGRSRRIAGDAVGEARAAVAAGALPVEALARFKRVRDLVDEGWRAYLRVAVEVAAQRLANARTEAESLVAFPGGAEVYADAALRLGIVLSHLGRKADANTVFALALALDPERPITKAEFDPDMVDTIEGVRVQTPILEKLEITSSPPGAMIRVDTREVGRAPLVVDVPRGQHVIVARLPQHRAVAQGIAVGEGAAQAALVLDPDPELVRLAGGAELGLDEAEQQRLVDATLRYADLDEIVIVAETTRRGGPALLAQRCGGIPAKCSAVVDIGFSAGEPTGLAAAARSVWDAMRTGELRYRPSVFFERAGRGGTKRCELCRSPWLWSGVGAALIVGAIVTIAATSSSRPPPIVGIDPSQYLPR